nr:acetyl-CoA carboxylase biotin carboxylase subunit [Gemmatimonadota bacterium]
DLVEWQLRIAAGERLPFAQSDIVPRGWAIECRLTSEDPANDFLPSTGRVSYLRLPSGPGVRWDGGIAVGSEVGLFYDAMLAKLIVWGPTRDRAISRMRRALLELTVEGVETSRDFHLRVMEDEEFRRGDIEIQWLERRLSSLVHQPAPESGTRVAAIVAALLAHEDRGGRESSGGPVTEPALAAATESWRRVARRQSQREG